MDAGQAMRLAGQIEAAVRGTPGVRDVYRAGSLTSNAIDAGARGLGLRDEGTGPVIVQATADGTRVHVAIGVDTARGAGDTTRAVHRAARDVLAAHGVGDADVGVTVVHVHEASPALPGG
ncbi:hypothetical protein [Myceligenerans xiligouense]|uniref:Uncharacterized protein n=1 Tax=Myceligenerans xiligouense TaxID=253184 RepID=A0A3N4Z6H7_9MICO|nr:hypothetical protein [Myceligenerans xiligouense]RPF20892.1 hypothetical protein EDD34_1499 [Myceligenerans xiligouense]